MKFEIIEDLNIIISWKFNIVLLSRNLIVGNLIAIFFLLHQLHPNFIPDHF